MSIFSIDYILFHIGNYPLSFIELLGTVSGLLSVWWAARENILTWPSGLVNVTAFFLLFYQTQLYSDMLLQVFFAVTTVYGWHSWVEKKKEKTTALASLTMQERALYVLGLAFSSLIWGLFMSQIHLLLPSLFPQEAALPFIDAFTAMASVVATFLLARKKWESWVLWIIVDAISIFVYYYKNLYVVAVEYIVFLMIASYGLYRWRFRKGL